MIAGLIVAAGKQSRFESNIPKALYPYKNTTILEHNISILKHYVHKIYVVVSLENYFHFEKIKGITLIKIDSGYGCGDAVLKALEKIKEEFILQTWGDNIIKDDNICKELINKNEYFVMPVVYEEDPYVKIKIDKNCNIKKVLYSKYGEIDSSGYHDLSIFFYEKNYILNLLKFFLKKRGNELVFLDICNVPGFLGRVIFKNYKSTSFNTIEELKEIINENS